MSTRNPVDNPIHELLANRWSPYSFDADREVSRSDLLSIFEAARWAMSCFNDQPWRYIVGVRGRSQETWDAVHGCLMEGNQGWTRNAPVLALGLAERNFRYNGKPNRHSAHDLGAASASLSYEAVARGIAVHQMAGFHSEKVREVFGLAEDTVPVTALALGYAAQPADDEFGKRDGRTRERLSLDELIVHGGL